MTPRSSWSCRLLDLRLHHFLLLCFSVSLSFSFCMNTSLTSQTVPLLRALAELVTPTARTAQVSFECGWTAVLAVLQLGATVDMTVNGPLMMCQADSEHFTLPLHWDRLEPDFVFLGSWGACASSSLLVLATWSSSFTRACIRVIYVNICSLT